MLFVTKAYASNRSGGTRGAASAGGQAQIRANMTRAGATERQIRAAQRRARQLPNARVTTTAPRGQRNGNGR